MTIRITKMKVLSVTLLAATSLLSVLVVYARANRIRSYDDWTTRNSVLSAPHPVNRALKSGKLACDTSVAELLLLATPTQSADFGRIKYFWFRPNTESYQVAICVDERVATVVASDPDCNWTFFDDPDPRLVDAMQTVRSIRDRLIADPTLKASVEEELHTALVTLGLPVDSPLPADSHRILRSGDGALSGKSPHEDCCNNFLIESSENPVG